MNNKKYKSKEVDSLKDALKRLMPNVRYIAEASQSGMSLNDIEEVEAFIN